MPTTKPKITKRKVTMRAFAGYDAEGNMIESIAVDYVNEEDGILDAYVAARRSAGWNVQVGDYDAGPGGYDGETFVPGDIDHPRAGEYRPATGQAFHSADPRSTARQES